ncbi:MAG TPA: tRNA epoxyqueuosine(34) reductase QueG [Deltaproteobacteria bacterium]|nr:tRNA epoxyqueuosine(34) reductase QueG [Deltaproteobacteria bacterium]
MDSAKPRLQAEVRQELSRLGFTQIRFARPPLGAAALRFEEWLQRGYQGEMKYLERGSPERKDPNRLLAGFKSLIVLGYGYDSALPNTANPLEGNISRYAWGEDYHAVVGAKLESFSSWLKSRMPQSRLFYGVDAAPILEKAWAEQAGLGWLGKHTNMIDPECGSYFFLAVLLSDLEFAPDAAQADRCGLCTRCIEVCPTRAIVAPYRLDARLCISYLTIELKGPIPRDLRPLVGNHIFGCDDCQEVCPWNRFSRPTAEGRFFPRPALRNQPLLSFLSLDEAAFKKKFAGSAVLRAKRRGFLRNVCVAIGNSGHPESAKALLPALRDSEALVRGHAVWAYARLLGEQARPALEELKVKEKDAWVCEEIEAALINLPL